MIFSEILVLFLALVIAITLVLMLRKLFFGRKSKIQIDKKVNSRELFEPVGSENSEKEILVKEALKTKISRRIFVKIPLLLTYPDAGIQIRLI